MKYLVYLGHPAHFHLFRLLVNRLRDAGHEVLIVIKQKDVLEDLLRGAGLNFVNIYQGERSAGRLAVALSLVRRDRSMLRIAAEHRPTLMIGTSAEISHVGRLLRIPSLVVNEDDWNVVPLFALMAYPFATHLIAPVCCNMGPWRAKTITYPGYHELAYLHPNNFSPRPEVPASLSGLSGSPYFILRFAKLAAHHDVGRRGIASDVAIKLVELLSRYGRVYISSERELEPELEPFRIRIAPLDMHHALAGAQLYVGDSQTMAAEAAVLGTPSIRFNDFVSQIGYLEELEQRYELTFGVPTDQPDRLLRLVEELAASAKSRNTWEQRRFVMLRERIDVAAFLAWFIETYPESVEASRSDPGVFERFTRFDPIAVPASAENGSLPPGKFTDE